MKEFSMERTNNVLISGSCIVCAKKKDKILTIAVRAICFALFCAAMQPLHAQNKTQISACGPNVQGACCATNDPKQPWVECRLLNKQSGVGSNVAPGIAPNKAAALGGFMDLLRSMGESEERSLQKKREESQRESEELIRQSNERIKREEQAYEQEQLRLAEYLKNNKDKKIECDCSVTQGSCQATINVLTSSGVSGGYAAEYKVTSSQVCSRVDYYIDNTPNTSILKTSTASTESSFGTSPITDKSFQVISCKPCKRN